MQKSKTEYVIFYEICLEIELLFQYLTLKCSQTPCFFYFISSCRRLVQSQLPLIFKAMLTLLDVRDTHRWSIPHFKSLHVKRKFDLSERNKKHIYISFSLPSIWSLAWSSSSSCIVFAYSFDKAPLKFLKFPA